MFTAPRFVAIDDNEQHLQAILATFQRLGSPCLGIRYDPATPLESEFFRGVRVLFIDLHLLGGIPATEETPHFAQIASILEDNIPLSGGPFVLVVWTQYPQHCGELRQYLDASLDPARPYARPLAVIPLEKERFLNPDTGEVQRAAELRTAVLGAIWRNSQLAALLSWEADVLAATGATLAALLELISPDLRRTASYSDALDEQLARLAVAAVGKPNVPADRRAAINSVLGPILADRIQNQSTTAEVKGLWDRAITKDQQNLDDLEAPQAGIVNRMLHLALPEAENIRPADWGAVVDFPAGWTTKEEMDKRFGLQLNTILGGDFKIEKQDRGTCRIKLVRAGAVCDYAQRHIGPIPYLLAVEVPLAVNRTLKTQASEWRSPTFVISAAEGPFMLIANARHIITLTEKEATGWAVRYRLREQLLMQLINHAGQYVTRPGIVMAAAANT